MGILFKNDNVVFKNGNPVFTDDTSNCDCCEDNPCRTCDEAEGGVDYPTELKVTVSGVDAAACTGCFPAGSTSQEMVLLAVDGSYTVDSRTVCGLCSAGDAYYGGEVEVDGLTREVHSYGSAAWPDTSCQGLEENPDDPIIDCHTDVVVCIAVQCVGSELLLREVIVDTGHDNNPTGRCEGTAADTGLPFFWSEQYDDETRCVAKPGSGGVSATVNNQIMRCTGTNETFLCDSDRPGVSLGGTVTIEAA